EDTVAQVRIARLHNALQREVRMYSAASPNNTQFAIRLNSNGADRGGFYIRDDGYVSMRTYTPSGDLIASRPFPFAMAVGEVRVTATDGIGDAHVSFPANRFTQTPIITVTAYSGSPALEGASITSASKDGFTAVMRRSNTTQTSIQWHAIQMLPDSAAG